MMKAWIISLRRKPKAVRERVALGAAVAVSTLIFAGWAATIPFRVADQPTQTANVFGGLFDTVQDELSNFKETMPAPAEAVVSEPAVTETTNQSATFITASTSTSTSVWTTPSTTTTPLNEPRPVRIATTTVTATGTTTTP